MPRLGCTTPRILRATCDSGADGTYTLEELGALLTPEFGNGTNLKVITKMEDFPAPDGDIIRLTRNTNYWVIVNGLVTANRFEWEGGTVAFTGLYSVGATQITYTGNADMFTAINGGLDGFRMVVDCPNGNFFRSSSSPPNPFTGLKLTAWNVISCKTLADVDNGGLTVVDGACLSCSNGFLLRGANEFAFSLRQFNFVDVQGGSAVNLGTSVWSTFEIRDMIVNTQTAATGISGLTNSGNIAVGRLATVKDSEIGSGVTGLSGITNDDVRWFFRDNNGPGVENTFIRARLVLTANATNTVIAAANTPVPIVGNWTISDNSQIVAGASNSQFQYVGERPLQLAIDVSVTLRAITGSPPFRVTIFKNGSALTGASVVLEPSTAVDLPGSIPWLESTVQNDLYEVYVENLQDATDVLVTDGVIRNLGDL